MIQDGNNYTVENKSTGFNANWLSPLGPNWGNISLGSMFKDINLVAGSAAGWFANIMQSILGPSRIFIEQNGPGTPANPGRIRLSSDAVIEIYSNAGIIGPALPGGAIKIRALTGDISLEATTGDINLLAGKSVNIQAGLEANITGTTAVNLNHPKVLANLVVPMFIDPLGIVGVRGYVPFSWMVGKPA